MTATATIGYRKTKQGEWVVCGPASVVRPGQRVTVTKRSGETREELVARTGREFAVDGVACCYGYIDSGSRQATRSGGGRCRNCRCHREPNAGAPGSIMFDGCDWCGCDSDC